MGRTLGFHDINGQTIEYSITGEKGEPVLVMHGGHSNCHEELGYHALIRAGFMIITPSRAGYGGTSKEIGNSLSKACDYYLELLNYLNIERVHILSISAGGPSGLYFASHYPERVKSLTLQSAVAKEWHTPEDNIYKLAKIMFHPAIEKFTWRLVSAMTEISPKFMFKQMAPSFSELAYKQIKASISADDIKAFQKMNQRQRSGYGFLIDLQQTKNITSEDLHAITCPTLIMHSKYDSAVTLDHAIYANQEISDSELCILESWGHLIWLGENSPETDKRLLDFLHIHSNS